MPRSYIMCGIRSALAIQSRLQSTSAEWTTCASLYVHWPYCNKRCTYCNFNKYISNSIDQKRMRQCLVTETETLVKLAGVKIISSIFFGGGTPSIAPPETIRAVLAAAASKCHVARDAEVTMEINPSSGTIHRLREYHAAGVNRFSIGLQTLSDTDLALLNRDHNVDDSLRCLEVCKSLAPGRVSVDVLFGRSCQTVESCRKELQSVLAAGSGRCHHLSLYQLTVERGTQLHKDVVSGKTVLPDEETVADMYEMAIQVLEEAGLKRYEVSNFAVPGHESVHNGSYWAGKQYIGIGPGAHGRFVVRDGDRGDSAGQVYRQARIQTLEPLPWMAQVERLGHGTRKAVQQTTRDILKELLVLGVRTTAGVNTVLWHALTGSKYVEDFLEPHALVPLINAGLIEPLDESGRILCTHRGLNVADGVGRQLVASLMPERQLQQSDS